MKKIIFALFLLPLLVFAQTDLDRIELKNGKMFDGKVVKVTSRTIEFVDNMTNLPYEFQKAEVKFLRLTNGTILTFEDSSNELKEGETQVIGGDVAEGKKIEPVPATPAANAQPIEIEEEREDENFSRTIVTVAGAAVAVILVALLIF